MYFNQKREKSRKNKEETTTGDKPLNTRREKINPKYLDKPTNHVNLIKFFDKTTLKKNYNKKRKRKKNHVLKQKIKEKKQLVRHYNNQQYFMRKTTLISSHVLKSSQP